MPRRKLQSFEARTSVFWVISQILSLSLTRNAYTNNDDEFDSQQHIGFVTRTNYHKYLCIVRVKIGKQEWHNFWAQTRKKFILDRLNAESWIQSTWFGEVNDLSIILRASHMSVVIGPLLKSMSIFKTLTAGVWETHVDESTISNSGECAWLEPKKIIPVRKNF